MKMNILVLGLVASLLGAGCASKLDSQGVANYNAQTIMDENEDAATALAKQIKRLDIKNPSVLVTPAVNLDVSNIGSKLGKIIAEQIGGGLVKKQIQLLDIKLKNNFFVQSAQGEILLSEEIKEISEKENIELVVVGTYTIVGSAAHVTLKAIDPVTKLVYAAHSYVLSTGPILN